MVLVVIIIEMLKVSTGTFRGGNMAATLFHSLAVNDIIDIRATLEGANGAW
jgi:hypothetical protein